MCRNLTEDLAYRTFSDSTRNPAHASWAVPVAGSGLKTQNPCKTSALRLQIHLYRFVLVLPCSAPLLTSLTADLLYGRLLLRYSAALKVQT